MTSMMASAAGTLLLLLLACSLSDKVAVSASPVPVPDAKVAKEIRSKRYIVNLPAAAVNLTGYVPAVVPLGQAVFGPQPYIIG